MRASRRLTPPSTLTTPLLLEADWHALRSARIALHRRAADTAERAAANAIAAGAPEATPSPARDSDVDAGAAVSAGAPERMVWRRPQRSALKRSALPSLASQTSPLEPLPQPGSSSLPRAGSLPSPLPAAPPPFSGAAAASPCATPEAATPPGMGSVFRAATPQTARDGDGGAVGAAAAGSGGRTVRWSAQALYKVYDIETSPVRLQQAAEEAEAIVDTSMQPKRCWMKMGGRKRRRTGGGRSRRKSESGSVTCGASAPHGAASPDEPSDADSTERSDDTSSDGGDCEVSGGDENGLLCGGRGAMAGGMAGASASLQNAGLCGSGEGATGLGADGAGASGSGKRAREQKLAPTPWTCDAWRGGSGWGEGGGASIADRALQQQAQLEAMHEAKPCV